MTPTGGSHGKLHRTARFLSHPRRRGGGVAARGARAGGVRLFPRINLAPVILIVRSRRPRSGFCGYSSFLGPQDRHQPGTALRDIEHSGVKEQADLLRPSRHRGRSIYQRRRCSNVTFRPMRWCCWTRRRDSDERRDHAGIEWIVLGQTLTLAELASSSMFDVPRASGRRLRCRGERPACSSRPRESGGWSR